MRLLAAPFKGAVLFILVVAATAENDDFRFANQIEREFIEAGVPIDDFFRSQLDEVRYGRYPRTRATAKRLLRKFVDVELYGKGSYEEVFQGLKERQQELKKELADAREELVEAMEKVLSETERLERLEAYCDNGDLYFRKTLMGFGLWVEEDESTGESTPIAEFDLNNAVLNRLMELRAAGWKNKIPAKTVACGPGVQAIYDVLR